MERKIGKYTIKVVDNDDESFPTYGFEITNHETGEFVDEWDGFDDPESSLKKGIEIVNQLIG